MKVVRQSTGEEVAVGSSIGGGLILTGILAEPSEQGYSGGSFAGRILAHDATGAQYEPLPFEYGLVIVP